MNKVLYMLGAVVGAVSITFTIIGALLAVFSSWLQEGGVK